MEQILSTVQSSSATMSGSMPEVAAGSSLGCKQEHYLHHALIATSSSQFAGRGASVTYDSDSAAVAAATATLYGQLDTTAYPHNRLAHHHHKHHHQQHQQHQSASGKSGGRSKGKKQKSEAMHGGLDRVTVRGSKSTTAAATTHEGQRSAPDFCPVHVSLPVNPLAAVQDNVSFSNNALAFDALVAFPETDVRELACLIDRRNEWPSASPSLQSYCYESLPWLSRCCCSST